MRRILSVLGAALVSLSLSAQTGGTEERSEQNQLIIDALDSLTHLFYKTKPQATSPVSTEVPVFTDSAYAYRLATIPSPIEMEFNPDVRQYIKLYTESRRSSMERMLGLAEMFFPLFEETLDKYQLPLELKYLPIIESALNPNAVSRVGATGLWQFMYTTGKMYGLEINSYVDARRDPRAATDAACRFLKDLYELYGDWSLVLAAYNSGPGNVNKAIRRSGGKTNYWDIREYLPRETRGYVPAFIGATYAFEYASDHNLHPELFDVYFEPTDTIHVRGSVKLSEVAAQIDMTTEELTFLNPALRRQKIPFTGEPYPLVLPMNKLLVFEEHRDTIMSGHVAAVAEKPSTTTIPTATASSSTGTRTQRKYNYTPYVPDTRGKTKLVYSVKSGDNLGYISQWYDCKVSDLQSWNGIRGTRIRVGQKLNVYVHNSSVSKYRNIDNLSFQQKQAIEGGSSTTASIAPSTSSGSSAITRYIRYTIKPGDNLWDISRKYPKNSVEDLKRINKITDLSVIKPGFVIKVGI